MAAKKNSKSGKGDKGASKKDQEKVVAEALDREQEAPKAEAKRAPKGEPKELTLEEELRAKLNIKTDYEKLPEGSERKSSFSDGVAAYKRGNRYYTEEEYQRTRARREKLEARLIKQMKRAEEEAEKATAAA